MPKLIYTFFDTLPLTIAGFFYLTLLDVNWQGLELLTRMPASIFGHSASQELESLCNRQRYGEKSIINVGINIIGHGRLERVLLGCYNKKNAKAWLCLPAPVLA